MSNEYPEAAATMKHSFIVKIWLEETGEKTGHAIWRGYITHVLSEQRRYLQNLDDIPDFIAPYLERMGGKPSLFWQVRRWLRRRIPSWARTH